MFRNLTFADNDVKQTAVVRSVALHVDDWSEISRLITTQCHLMIVSLVTPRIEQRTRTKWKLKRK